MGVAPDGKAIPFQAYSQKFMRNYFKIALRPLQKQGVDFWWLDWGPSFQGWLNELYFNSVARNGRRGASFSRWGGWGDQRYPVNFSGDTFSRWRVLKFEVPFTTTGGNVGAFYWSNDIGGFQKNIPTPELYTRWVQFGVLSPVFRTHANEYPLGDHRRPWLYGRRAEHAMRIAYDLRSRLFPYIYTCAWQGWKNSMPLLRPLYLEYSTTPAAYTHPDEYFFGPSLLVRPITSHGQGPACVASSDLWFPKGTWWNLLTHASVTGSSQHRIFATLDQIPVFAKGGVPLPMQKCTMRMAETPANPMVVCVYPGPDGHSNVYEDDGVTTDYRHGQSAITPLEYFRRGSGVVTIQIGPTRGSYSGQADRRALILRLPVTPRPAEVQVNGRPLSAAPRGEPGFSYNAMSLTTQVCIPPVSIRKKTIIRVTCTAPQRLQSLLAKIVNEMALINCALAGSAGNQDAWKIRLEAIHFQLGVLCTRVADGGANAVPAKFIAEFNTLNSQLAQIGASLNKASDAAGQIADKVLTQGLSAARTAAHRR